MDNDKVQIFHKKLKRKSKKWKKRFKKLLMLYFKEFSSKEKEDIDYLFNFYLRNNIKYFIEELDFVYYLSKKNKNEFICFPIRKIMERLLKIENVINLPSKDQELYIKVLLMRSSFRYYKEGEKNGDVNAMNTFKEAFTLYNIDPKKYYIDKVTDEWQIKCNVPILGVKTLCGKTSKIKNVKDWYKVYQFYCDDVHGNLISDIMREENTKDKRLSFYNLPANVVLLYVKELCCVVDKHLDDIYKNDLDKLIKEMHEFNEKYLN